MQSPPPQMTLWQAFEQASARYRGQLDAKQFDYSTNISLQYRYLFVETPKAACSTIKTSLQRLEWRNPDFIRDEFEQIHDRNFSPLLKASQMGDLDHFMARDDIFRFCVVRNPYTRLLSAYLDKIINNQPSKLNILHHLGLNAADMETPIDFATFVRVACSQRPEHQDPHWRIQYIHTCQSSIDYHRIGKVERLQEDFTAILQQITPEAGLYFSTEKRHSTQSDARLRDYYTPQLIELVRNAYAQDFAHFGYSEELP